MMSVAMPLEPIAVPLAPNANGTLYVRDTGVRLERIIYAYKAGHSPADIVDMFDALRLADVFAVICYYLDHQEEVDGYMEEYERESMAIRKKIEARQPSQDEIKTELLSRKAARNGSSNR
jgi:uncharacterized protein (DUF433 family)